MTTLGKALTALAALAFVLAVLTHFAGPIVGTYAEAYSRACSNLALMAIALTLVYGNARIDGRT
jgi:hypothetical protein